jgi:hypothetical protein
MAFLWAFLFYPTWADLHLKVEAPSYQFTIEIQKNVFRYSSPLRQVQKKIDPCAAPAFDQFSTRLQKLIQADAKPVPAQNLKRILASVNGKNSALFPLSQAAVALSQVETEIDYLMTEAEVRCEP